MIHAKNCEKLPKFVTIMAKMLLVPFFPNTVYNNNNNNNNNNQHIYKQRQSHAMSQRRWLATAVIFRPSDVSLGFAET